MKRLSTWDTYVQEAGKEDRSIEIPLTPDETYVVPYPTRRQGREIARAQTKGDTDALLVAMLGDEAGNRVKELAEDQPAYVLDDFLIDVMKKFGMLPDEPDEPDEDDEVDEPDAATTPPTSTRNGHKTNGVASKGKGRAKGSTTSSKRSPAA